MFLREIFYWNFHSKYSDVLSSNLIPRVKYIPKCIIITKSYAVVGQDSQCLTVWTVFTLMRDNMNLRYKLLPGDYVL